MTFTAAALPGVAAGHPMPFSVVRWRWEAGGDSAQTVACTTTGATCRTAVHESGTMYVDAIVNGKEQTKEVEVQVFSGTPQLVLEADASTVAPGEMVIFTARALPDTINGQAVTITDLQWSWASGPMFSMAGPPNRGRHAGRAATASMSSTLRNSDCTPGVNPCISEIYIDDVLTVMAKLNGQEASPASGSVTVQSPCPPVDSLLDHPEIRKMFRELMDSSFVDSSASKRKERKAFIYDSAGKIIYRISPLTPESTPCASTGIEPVPSPGTKIAEAHTQPFKLGDRLPLLQCFPDRAFPPGTTVRYSDLYGGPSPADWATTVRTGVPELIVDKTNIYRADPLISADFDLVGDRYLPKADAWKQNLTRAKRKEGSCTRI